MKQGLLIFRLIMLEEYTIQELNKIIQDREKVTREIQRVKYNKELEETKKNLGIDLYARSDYAGLSTKEYGFYYGYEETLCPFHKLEHCNCEESEWCFTVTKGKKEIMRIPKSKLWLQADNTFQYLVYGIAQFINSLKSS